MIFFILSLSPCIDASPAVLLLVKPLPPPFLDTYNLFMSSVGCKTLYTIIHFLLHWFICLNSSFTHFKNGPGYLTRRTTLVFIPLMKFLLQILISRSFLVHARYFFLIFFISACLMESASSIPKLLLLLFTSWEFFTSIFSWWFFTVVWVTASFLKSPGLFSVFWLFNMIIIMIIIILESFSHSC